MIQRCHNPNVEGYVNYGGRGIVVHPMWRTSFAAFLEHIGPYPGPGYSVERIDNARSYEPGNVRWATAKEQALNRRSNVVVEFRGERRCLSEWAKMLDVSFATLKARIFRLGWSVERAFATPKRGQGWRRESQEPGPGPRGLRVRVETRRPA
jgi:hypothetical protein